MIEYTAGSIAISGLFSRLLLAAVAMVRVPLSIFYP